jgi:membrane protease YdiL (CAAX protease family)
MAAMRPPTERPPTAGLRSISIGDEAEAFHPGTTAMTTEAETTPQSSTKEKLALTVKAWPVITLSTLALCFLTQQTAKLLGIELPDQANLEAVLKVAGWNWRFAFLALQITVILPAIEEVIFRLPLKLFARSSLRAAVVSAAILSALFSAAHYIFQPFPDSAFIALFFFGMAQAWIYRQTGSIFCAMLNHALFNLTNLVLLLTIGV